MAELVHDFLPEGFVDVPLDGPYWVIPLVSPLTSESGDDDPRSEPEFPDPE